MGSLTDATAAAARELLGTARRMRAPRRRARGGAETEAQAPMRAAFLANPLGQAVLDGAGRMVDVNPAPAGMLGRGRGQMAGRSLLTAIHPDDRGRLRG